MTDNYGVKVQATASVKMPTASEIDKQIRNLEKSISKLKVSGQFDDTALRNLTNQLNSLKATISTANFSPTALSDLTNQVNRALQNINIGNINVGGAGNQAQQVGQQIGQQISQGIKQNIDTNVVNIDTTTAQKEIEEITKITDNYGRELDELNSKLLATSKMMNTQGKLITLFHGSKSDFDSFDISASDRHSNNYGQGAYFYDNPSNSIGYGNVSQWFANVEKIFESSAKLSAQEIQTIYDKYKSQIKECLDIDNLMDFTSHVNSGDTVNRLRTLSDFLGLPTDNSLLKSLGYDAILSKGFDVNEYIILDESKIIKANSALKEQVSLITSVQEAQQMEENADPKRNLNKSIIDGWKAKREAEQQAKETSDVSTQAVIQNEEKKQQAIQETARLTESLNDEDNSDRIKELAVEKAKARDEINELRKEIEDETGVKVSVSDIKQAQKEIDQANKVQQEGTRENIKLREQEVAHTRMLAKETKANADLEVANRQREMKLENQSASEELANRKRVAQEQKVATQEELTSREQVRKLNEQTFKEESSARKQASAELKLQAQEQRALQTSLNSPESKISEKLKNESYSTDIDKLKKQFQDYGLTVDQAEEKVKDLRDTLKDMKGLSGDELIKKANEWDNAFEKVKVQLDQTKLAYDQLENVNRIQLLSKEGKFTSQISDVTADYNRLSQVTDELKADFKTLNDLGKVLNTSADADTLTQSYEQFNSTLQKVKNSISILDDQGMMYASQKKVDNLAESVLKFRDNNTKMSKDLKAKFTSLYNSLINGVKLTDKQVDELTASFASLKLEVRAAGQLGQSFGNKMKNAIAKFAEWGFSSNIVMETVQAIKNGVTNVIELDTAMVDLQKTANMSTQELEDFYYTSNDVAKQMGVTTQEIIDQSSAWSRLGYNTAEAATQMAKLSSQFKLISPGMTSDEATDGLVSIMKAYDVEVNDVLDGIMSKVNIIGNKFALSNSDIISMLQDSVSAMAEGNNTLEETIALETAAFEITQDRSVGNGFKTVALRLRGLNEETQELDDSLKTVSGDLYDLTGVSVMQDANTYKSTYQILKDINEVWDSLSDKTQAEALELMFGKQRANVGAAVLKNFEAVERAMDEMANSAGNAEAEMAIAMDSIDYKLNILSETGTAVSQNLFNREDMKTVLDGINTLGGAVEWLTDKLGLFGTIGVIGGGILGVKNAGICV